MSKYIAQETTVSVLGVEFQGYKTETGSVVYSQQSAANGLGVARSTLQNALKSIRGLAALKALASESASHSGQLSLAALKVRTTSGIQKISTISKPELIALVDHLASKGNAQAKALVLASFAVVLQQSLEYCLENINETIFERSVLSYDKFIRFNGFVNIFG